VPDVVGLGEPSSATREATTLISVEDAAVGVVLHHHPACVACHALRRFRGNARAAFHDGLARRIGVFEHRRIDVHDDLVALCGRAGVDPVVKRRLGDEHQCIGQLLGHRRRFRRNVVRA
jgi:hypothetical protein